MATEPRTSIPSDSPWHALARASEHAPVGLILIDTAGRVLKANPQALATLGLTESDAINQSAASLFDCDDHALRDAILNGGRYNARAIVHTRDGLPIDCDLSLYPLETNGGEACRALWLNDVSEHVAMQRSLLQAERLSALGEIVAGVAHELNNPLTGILGYAQLLLDDVPGEKNRQRLEHIVNEAMRCEAIVQSLRGFSSHAVAEQALHDLNRVVDNMVTLLEYQMRVDAIEVSRSFTEDTLTAFVDAHAIGRAILNIVHNAHQALQLIENRPRRFTVATESNDREIQVRFTDNGPGIKPEHLPRIFDPFFTTREFGRGVGLGLSVAYGVVREHGGRIDVQSTPGHGAEFVIHLPRAGESR